MHLYKVANKRDINDIAIQLSRASNIGRDISSHPHGFDSIVNFDFGHIYIDNNLFNMLDENLCQEIDACLRKIVKGDYGIVSPEDIEENNESRYFGTGELTAKYKISIGAIQIAKFYNKTVIEMAL